MMKAFRQAARRLAPYRDAEALHETLDWLLEKERKSFSADEISSLENIRRDLPGGQFDGLRTRLQQGIAACVGAIALLAKDFARDPDVIAQIQTDGLRSSLRTFGAAWTRYYSRASVDDLHRLRKRAKDLQYLYEMIGNEKSRKAFAKVGRRLGRSRDLARLAEQEGLPRGVRSKIQGLSNDFAEQAVRDAKVQLFSSNADFQQAKKGRRGKASAPRLNGAIRAQSH
jgi:CHAD domain-containing protein